MMLQSFHFFLVGDSHFSAKLKNKVEVVDCRPGAREVEDDLHVLGSRNLFCLGLVLFVKGAILCSFCLVLIVCSKRFCKKTWHGLNELPMGPLHARRSLQNLFKIGKY